jgi:hypothetical protein
MKMLAILKEDFLNELTLMNVRRESKEEVLEEEEMSLSLIKIKAINPQTEKMSKN